MKSNVVLIAVSTTARPRDNAAAGDAFDKNSAEPEFFRLSQDTFALIGTTVARSVFVVCVSRKISVNAAGVVPIPQLIFSMTTIRLLFAGLRSRTPLCEAATAGLVARIPKRYQSSRARKSCPIELNWMFGVISVASCAEGGPPFIERSFCNARLKRPTKISLNLAIGA